MPSIAIAALATVLAAQDAPPVADSLACARQVLERAAQAYRAMPVLRDRLRYIVEAPGSERVPKDLAYGSGPGTDAYATDPGLAAYAEGKRLRVVRAGAPQRYVDAPYAGDFRAALDAVTGAEGSLFEPPPIAMRTGKGFEAWLDGLRFKQLGPLQVVGCARELRGEPPVPRDVVRLEAANGSVRVALDASTHLFSDISLELRPPGAPPGFAVRVEGTFSPEALAAADPAGRFDPAGRTAVATLADLGSDRLAQGSPAPDLVLLDLQDRPVALRDLRGQVIVLDLWATWCVPCWKGLRHAQDLAVWARSEGLPVRVLAVNTLEELASPSERRERVGAFWRSQGLSLDVLLDLDDTAFRALGSPGLPSLVVIDKAGQVRAVHAGALATPEVTLRAAVRGALDQGAPGQ